MPYSSSNSISYSTDTILIPEPPYYNQAHSLISQAPFAITFSTASPTSLPMTDHHHNNNHSIDIRALDARLARVEQLQQLQQEDVSSSINETTTTSINGHNTRRCPRPPLDTTATTFLTRPFTKSSTMSSTSTSSTTTRLHPETVGLAPGTFSKPRVPRRSRRASISSSNSASAAERRRGENHHDHHHQQPEFRYYGRHGNQWLFNDFSVTGAVARGVKRVFGGSQREGDWFEERK